MKNVKKYAEENVAHNVAIYWATSCFQKITMGYQK